MIFETVTSSNRVWWLWSLGRDVVPFGRAVQAITRTQLLYHCSLNLETVVTFEGLLPSYEIKLRNSSIREVIWRCMFLKPSSDLQSASSSRVLLKLNIMKFGKCISSSFDINWLHIIEEDRPLLICSSSSPLSIGPRWLMPRMYCSHIGLLYYP